jgi:hypothetical protein
VRGQLGGIFIIAYVTRHLGLSRELALGAVLAANLTALAALHDYIGPRLRLTLRE